MTDTAIKVENLSKRYRIGQYVGSGSQYKTLRESLTNAVSAPLRRLKSISKFEIRNSKSDNPQSAIHDSKSDTPQFDRFIWALKDVSFEVKQGEVLGIIGKNGAGKSTLLKILSRITEPTEGYAKIRGRVRTLLEVGTGFHAELTGRENVYLSGAILGMARKEIDRKFDEIVSFSGVEKFLDTPVKRYSSGMRVRLGFAVAAHLEPEILLIDEVLAVGDAEFQKKCLGKMDDVAKEGRTVLFVSHNMAAIQRLCERGIVLNDGAILMDGPVDKAVGEYLQIGVNQQGERIWTDMAQAPGDDVVRLVAVRTKNQFGEICSQFDVCDPVAVEIDYIVLEEGYQLCAVLEFVNAMGQGLFVAFDDYIYGTWGKQDPCPIGSFRSTCLIPGDFLTEGGISINLRIFSPPFQPNEAFHVRELEILRFTINDRMDPGSVRGNYPHYWGAPAVRPRLRWLTEYSSLEEAGFKIKETT